MCGIAGLVLRHGAVEREMLQPMADRLRHRGPDDVGIRVEGNVGLVHTRLSIIDLSGGHQPICSEDGRLAVIANGEIYNHIELRQELEAQGSRFVTHSDSETILHAYAQFGDGFVERLHGMFAFALHDRERHRLILARDRLGIKPLFVAQLPDRLAFGSEIKSVTPLLPRTPQVNPRALAQFLDSQFNTGRETILEEVERIAPGEMMIVDTLDLGVVRKRYWSPLGVEPRRLSLEEAEEEFAPLFEQVMQEHMRSDVPYGVFLSGGNDSAILCAMLDRYGKEPVRSFSVGFTGVGDEGELPDAERIAGLLGTRHTSFRLDRDAVFGRLVHTVWAADDLMRDYASLPTSILAQEAAKELKVVFTGEGGDEVFGGYRRYRMSPLMRFIKGLIEPGTGGFRTRSQLQSRWRRRLFGPELKATGAAFRTPYLEAWRRTPASWTDIQRSQYTDLETALPDNLLVKTDRMLMGFGLEGRVPYLDHRVVEFGLSLPDELKIRGKQSKVMLRKWAETLLPADHLNRPKRGFHVPIGDWLKGPFLDRLEGKLQANPAVRTWFNASALPDLFAAQRKAGSKTVSREIWSLMQFAIWHRIMIERPGSVPTPQESPLDWIT
jgi:asparagine synthase (glutamine-hydrolysing)